MDIQTTSLAVWEQFSGSLETFIHQKLNYTDQCNDILQDLYLKVYINIGKIEKAGNIRAYLFQMAHNAVTDYHRKQQRAPALENDEIISLLEDKQDELSEYQLADCCLRPMIETLPEIYRQALILTELEGHTQQQLADKLDISLPAAKSRVQRAREKLKEIILQCCNYEFDKYGNILSCCSSAHCKTGNC
ncbi:RNA polymerase sigma factor SigZ [Chitinophaga agrisoli]|uniref:RNA polymerase sigma factor SigZ n=1 Tax=Chitinophaga agrisoli TaxID=2607653 RepID=A0A5B2VXF2_9BACT|nr:RNA polymerase sigma factor SigZ [Chitinophaga agrisoli]KAA2242689.1 RNA polymerase sigma factor SigZ [Chitinophaga agrisoli]